MASTRFTVLTGHLSQHSLADLIGILRHQRKTGRLLIEYVGSPAILFFKDGDLVDAQYNTLIGVQAIFVSFVQPAAAFNFNPLMQPTRYSIDSEQQRVILELLGCWTDDMIVVKSTARSDKVTIDDLGQPELQSIEPQMLISPSPLDKPMALNEVEPVLALPAAPVQRSKRIRSTRRPWVLALATFVLLLVFGVPTLIAISNKVRKAPSTTSTPAPGNVISEQITVGNDPGNSSQVVAKTGAAPTADTLERKHERDRPSGETRSDKAPNDAVPTPASTNAAAQSPASSDQTAQADKPKQSTTTGQTIKVIMRIENGRVVQATVGDRRPGSEAYESLALRIARQRRYPAGVNKQETLIMKVDGPK